MSETFVLEIIRRLHEHAHAQPQAIAVHDGEQLVTWANLDARSAAVAEHLRQSLEAGDVVLLSGPNAATYVAALLGILRAGMTAFCLAPDATALERRRAIEDGAASAVIASACAMRDAALPALALEDVAALPEPRRPAEPERFDQSRSGLYLHSSGTTDAPRIAARSGTAVDAVARNVAGAIGLDGAHAVIGAIPMTHAYGVENALLAPIYAGSTLLPLEGFDPDRVIDVIGAAGAQQAIVLPCVPFMFEVLAGREPRGARGRIALAYSAGASLPESVRSAFLERYGIPIGELYGATEIGSVTFRDPRRGEHGADVGRPMPGVHLRIVDGEGRTLPAGQAGEVIVSAPSMMRKYLGDAGAPLRDGFFHTGDLGALDAEGRLVIQGRIKHQIDVGARKVNPQEVESVLMQHPAVRDCAVVAMPISSTLHRLRAIVVAGDHASPPPAEDLRAFCREHLAPWKIPRTFEFRSALPRSRAGKLLRGQLV